MLQPQPQTQTTKIQRTAFATQARPEKGLRQRDPITAVSRKGQ